MDYSKLATFDFLFSLGYVTLGASAVTIVLTEVAELVFRRAATLRPGVDPTRRDIFLSGVGIRPVLWVILTVVSLLSVGSPLPGPAPQMA